MYRMCNLFCCMSTACNHNGKDIYGFLYPKIDHNKCIECNLCEKNVLCYINKNTKFPKNNSLLLER